MSSMSSVGRKRRTRSRQRNGGVNVRLVLGLRTYNKLHRLICTTSKTFVDDIDIVRYSYYIVCLRGHRVGVTVLSFV